MSNPRISPIDNKPIEHPDRVREAFYYAFRLFYAKLIIDRAENPSTLSEQNNCTMCQGTDVYHHCMFDTCRNQDQTEECLHMRPEEFRGYEELRRFYKAKFVEARFVLSEMGSTQPAKWPPGPFLPREWTSKN